LFFGKEKAPRGRVFRAARMTDKRKTPPDPKKGNDDGGRVVVHFES
jgi:hypothetical protein